MPILKFSDFESSIELQDSDVETIKNALTNCAGLCETDAKNMPKGSGEERMFMESAASYRATLAKLEGE